jgi:hypothetical protein
MAYFQELPETIQAQLWEELCRKMGYSEEMVDDWINRHNWDLSNAEWYELVGAAEKEL